jgi:hypothetical protein
LEERDLDGDGYVACSLWADTQGDDTDILGGDDCDPSRDDISPGAAPAESTPGACMKDSDGDDYGDLDPPAGVVPGTDCDDDSPDAAVTFPGAASVEAPLNCMKDADDDGYGDASVLLPVVPGSDCDDSLAAVNPGQVEGPFDDPVCSDTLDNDCDQAIDNADPGCSVRSPRRTQARPDLPIRTRPTLRSGR